MFFAQTFWKKKNFYKNYLIAYILNQFNISFFLRFFKLFNYQFFLINWKQWSGLDHFFILLFTKYLCSVWAIWGCSRMSCFEKPNYLKMLAKNIVKSDQEALLSKYVKFWILVVLWVPMKKPLSMQLSHLIKLDYEFLWLILTLKSKRIWKAKARFKFLKHEPMRLIIFCRFLVFKSMWTTSIILIIFDFRWVQ